MLSQPGKRPGHHGSQPGLGSGYYLHPAQSPLSLPGNHSDQGKQYAAASYRARLPVTTQVSMAAVGTPTDNALVERFIRTLKEEHIDYSDYHHFADAQTQLAHWLEVEYMTERIHSSLAYLTPFEFETTFFNLSDSSLVRA